MTVPALVFVGVCTWCGTPTKPCPAEGPGESWKAAEQWLYLAVKAHERECLGRPAPGGQMTIFGGRCLP